MRLGEEVKIGGGVETTWLNFQVCFFFSSPRHHHPIPSFLSSSLPLTFPDFSSLFSASSMYIFYTWHLSVPSLSFSLSSPTASTIPTSIVSYWFHLPTQWEVKIERDGKIPLHRIKIPFVLAQTRSVIMLEPHHIIILSLSIHNVLLILTLKIYPIKHLRS